MDFLATARLLMDIRKENPCARYHFDGDIMTIQLVVDPGVPEEFERAAQMFEPV